jgi:tetratricopeptide (TPR) repeat protein
MTQDGSQTPSPLFKKVDGGWLFRAPNAWVFGRAEHYLLSDTQRAAIHAILTPHRPVLTVAILIIVLLSAVGLSVGTAMLVYQDADKLTAVGAVAMISGILLLLYGALLVATRLRIRKLQPLLAGVPLTDQRITSADMRQAMTATMSLQKLLLLSGASAFACLAAGANVAILRDLSHPFLSDPQSWLFLFNTCIFGVLAVVYFRKLFDRLRQHAKSPAASSSLLTQRPMLVAIASLVGFVGLASAEAYVGMQREFSYQARGLRAQARGEVDLAIASFTNAIASDPNNTESYSARARNYVAKGDHDRAIADYTKVIEIKPANAFTYYYRGQSYAAKGDHDRAIADFSKVIDLIPKATYAYQSRGASYAAKGVPDRAIADYTHAIEIDPALAAAYLFRGVVYAVKGDQDRAIADYTRAIDINPKDAVGYQNRGVALTAHGDCERAIADLTQAIAINPSYSYAYQSRGIALACKGEYEKAIADYTKGIELNPDNGNFYYFRSISYAAKSDYDRAIAGLSKYIQFNPNDPTGYHARAGSLAAKGEIERAIADYRRVIALPAASPAGLQRQDDARAQIARLTKSQTTPSASEGMSPLRRE